MRIGKFLLFVLILLACMELATRAFISINFTTNFWKPDLLLDHFYPELQKAIEFSGEKESVLVLGGSVLYEELVKVELNGELVSAKFCGLSKLLSNENYHFISLAQPGHTTLDSRYKYDYLKTMSFDYVFVYHGINDVRANNWPEQDFDINYRHIEFYDDLAHVVYHKELPYYTSLFTIDWLFHSLQKRGKTYLPKELFHGLLSGEPEEFLKYGNEIKTQQSFKQNMNNILDIAKERGDKLILATYAWYLPPNYSFEAFKQKNLDYDQQIFPVELYGYPNNVVKGIGFHNQLIRDLVKEQQITFFDLENAIPKNRNYFDDICHLNENGCRLLSSRIDSIISSEHEKR